MKRQELDAGFLNNFKMKNILMPLEFIADKINWMVEESWYIYCQLIGNYWKRIDKQKLGDQELGDIVMLPFYLLLFLVYLMSGLLFAWIVFASPAILLEKFLENYLGEWQAGKNLFFEMFSIFVFIGWFSFVAGRPKNWPF